MLNYLENIVNFVNGIFWGKNLLAVMLLSTGLYFTIRTKFMPVRLFKEMIRIILEKNENKSEDENTISSFQAFCISTASRIGAGNLAGVVAAISIGGPGAVFWMWVVALVGASSAFIESTLAQIYKEKDPEGGYRGGPAYFMEKALKKRWMGILFAISGLICWAGISQIVSNSVTESFENAFNIPRIYTVSVLVIAATIIIFGKSNKTAKVLDKLVPIMASAYALVVVFIIITNINLIPTVFASIFSNAFGVQQVVGGGLGVVIMAGIKRGLFSNEAGSGSAPCAAAAAEVSHPAKQGLIQSLGVFIDTLVICSATAFVILLADKTAIQGKTGMTLLQSAMRYHLGEFGVIFIAIVLLLFAFSTFLGILFYAKSNVAFIIEGKFAQNLYKIFALSMMFVGGLSQYLFVWALADMGVGLMTVLNLFAIIPLGKIALDSLADYEENHMPSKKRSTKIEKI
ncbi:alanine/glycine:cation symporter family protein [Psychrilyobacter sp.]|uniref:alanine/glycine:cation symporter family protein n=1 Tax=Psychrilyobacter sp. TaxID=2586924 RepID=UPI00301ADD7B